MSTLLMLVCALSAPAELPAWGFDAPAILDVWRPNGHLDNVLVQDGVVHADAVDWDPFFTNRNMEFAVSPWQYVRLRIRADEPGRGELFWSHDLEGKYGGLGPEKSTPFHLKGDGTWEDVVLFPFWHKETTIRQLRLDVYEGAHFELDRLAVHAWDAGRAPLTDVHAWRFDGDPAAWRVCEASQALFAPPLAIPTEQFDWVTVAASSQQETSATLYWVCEQSLGPKTSNFTLPADSKARHHNLELAGHPDWRGDLVALGLEWAAPEGVALESVALNKTPTGEPRIAVQYFGPENGANRAGRPANVLGLFWNNAGPPSPEIACRLEPGPGLRIADDAAVRQAPPLAYDDQAEVRWRVVADKPGTYALRLVCEGPGAPGPVDGAIAFLPDPGAPKAAYVPEPRPVDTVMDVCMYYFPGWNSDAKYVCIRRTAPWRKPLLGYYDEGTPECVDWQIKWAVENGISCFLVDWYWVDGHQHLQHWFDAYRQAKYRSQLDVAIMWANHNPPGTHSRADWRKVTREWIDHYFNLDTYYRIDGKPAVFLWSPNNIRNDLGGTEEVKAAFAESQAMAREAGYEGIAFLAMFGHESASGVEALLEEGYYGATNYHEWGKALERSGDPKRADYADIAATVRQSWEEKTARCGELVYYPVADTGWDARPWHGDKSLVITGRTVPRFESVMRQARDFAQESGREFVVLGPANEWGEGSYIEPCTEYGFGMYEAVRRVFAKGGPGAWPVNLGPADIGLGPYDFPRTEALSAWDFEDGPQGWSGMMGVADVRVEDGRLCFRTSTSDPALVVNTQGLPARSVTKAVIEMQTQGASIEGDRAQIFFAVGGRGTSEAASYRFPLQAGGAMHTYTVDLSGNPRWRSRISTLRFDPCTAKGVDVALESFRLE